MKLTSLDAINTVIIYSNMFERCEAKLTALKDRLASEIDSAATTLPTIIADSLDDEDIERMVSQAKVCMCVFCGGWYTTVYFG